jgi:hypothetical protein
MIRRLNGVPNGDLVAMDARYHRKKNCLSTYINPRNISAQRKSIQDSTKSKHDIALLKLIEELKPKIEMKHVFLLNSLRNRYRELLEVEGCVDPHLYTSQKLKERLMTEYPSLAFVPQKGYSDLVCLAQISVQEVLLKANELAKDLQSKEEEETRIDIEDARETASEESIVHQACGILRKHIEQTRKIKGEYYSPVEVTLEGQRKYVDPLLYKAICWLIDQNLFKEAGDVPTDARYLSIACDITTLSTGIMSPKHLGLAVYLHHTFGSRNLIDLLYCIGSCISYTELRTFLTSAALHVDRQQRTNNVFIPPELIPVHSGGRIIFGAADNWDHNEHTIDGKRTTHAMTSILLQPTLDIARDHEQRIQRATERSLDINKLKGYFVMTHCLCV